MPDYLLLVTKLSVPATTLSRNPFDAFDIISEDLFTGTSSNFNCKAPLLRCEDLRSNN